MKSPRAVPWIGGAAIIVLLFASLLWQSVPSFLALALPLGVGERYWYSLPEASRSHALYWILGVISTVGVALAIAGAFFGLCRLIERRPERAWGFLAISGAAVGVLSTRWHVTSWQHGMRYQGADYLWGNLEMSVLVVFGMTVLWLRWRLRPEPVLPMAVLWLQFAWVLGFAFPWLGESM